MYIYIYIYIYRYIERERYMYPERGTATADSPYLAWIPALLGDAEAQAFL